MKQFSVLLYKFFLIGNIFFPTVNSVEDYFVFIVLPGYSCILPRWDAVCSSEEAVTYLITLKIKKIILDANSSAHVVLAKKAIWKSNLYIFTQRKHSDKCPDENKQKKSSLQNFIIGLIWNRNLVQAQTFLF